MSEQEKAKQEFLEKLRKIWQERQEYEAAELVQKMDEAFKKQQEKKKKQ